jgi:hypothetical protein
MICSCPLLARAAIQAGVSSDASFAFSDIIINRIEGFADPVSTLAYEREILIQFLALVKMNQKRAYSRTVRRALQYMGLQAGACRHSRQT